MPAWGWSLVIPLAFILWWCWLIWVMAHINGWSNLGHHYRTSGSFHGTVRRFRSGRLGWSNYGGCLTVGTNPEGLYLAVLFLFRPGHPPLFIPWPDVRATFIRGWLASRLELRFEKYPLVTLRLPAHLGRQIAADASRSWADERGEEART